jgi:hypothetical protein
MSVERVSEVSRESEKMQSELTRLNDVDGTIFEEPLEVPTRVKPLAQSNRARSQAVQFFDAFRMLAEKRLFDE